MMQKISITGYVIAFTLVCLFVMPSCINKPGVKENMTNNKDEASKVEVILLKDDTTSTVHISKYVLVTKKGEDRLKDAAEILTTKRKWPLAVQSKKEADFNAILTNNFTFTADEKIMNRSEYIQSRTANSDWVITTVSYDNLILQFFDGYAVLSYHNQVTNENVKTQEKEIELISWVDVYTKENDSWKINAAHVIEHSVTKQ